MLGFLAAAAAQVVAPVTAPAPKIITQPVWATIPSAAEFTATYPTAALRNRVEGRATLQCEVDRAGALVNCAVTQEEPAGAGFGEAAFRISALFRMRPLSQDRVRTAGGQITMPIRFKLPEELPPDAIPTGVSIQQPDWVTKPLAADFANVYPLAASNNELEGTATAACLVTKEGQLARCSVLSEDPVGQGFGEAVLKMTGLFKMKPLTVDGKPVAGGTVRIPIRFVLPQEEKLNDIVITSPDLVDSQATVNCRAQPAGVDNCWVVNDKTPNGYAGGLALQLAPRLHIRVDEPGRFRVRFVFKKGESPIRR